MHIIVCVAQRTYRSFTTIVCAIFRLSTVALNTICMHAYKNKAVTPYTLTMNKVSMSNSCLLYASVQYKYKKHMAGASLAADPPRLLSGWWTAWRV